jgi:hypothetical protein
MRADPVVRIRESREEQVESSMEEKMRYRRRSRMVLLK